MKNVVSLKRDLGSLSETLWVYILRALESDFQLEILGRKTAELLEL